MINRRDEHGMGADAFALMFASFISKVHMDDIGSSRKRLFEVGKRIGKRISDDFFMYAKPVEEMDVEKVMESVSKCFFPLYFSYTPRVDACFITLEDFCVLKYSRKTDECIEVLCGILQGVYCCVVKQDVVFEVGLRKSEYCIAVRTENERKEPVIIGMNGIE
ncbi:transport protein particle complex protein [Ordospora colligata]|nr:transport protein particle complex protein [Ordospora colligata]